jgi:hypothetical protein
MSWALGPQKRLNEDQRAFDERYRLWREQYKQQEELIEQQKRAADEAERANEIAQERASQSNWTPEGRQAVRQVLKDWREEIVYNQLKDQIISLENKVMMLEVELEKRIGESDKQINQIRYYLGQKDKNGFNEAKEWVDKNVYGVGEPDVIEESNQLDMFEDLDTEMPSVARRKNDR